MGGRSDQAQATVYQKHRSPQSRKTTYGGWRLPGAGRWRELVIPWKKLATEAPVNGGRNYRLL